MADELKVYECRSKTCLLGSRTSPGRFTGGMTPENLNLLFGTPGEECTEENEGTLWGEGVCPSCGEVAKDTGDEHVSNIGDDPYQDLHDEVGARVLDDSDPLTKDDAQVTLKELVADVK